MIRFEVLSVPLLARLQLGYVSTYIATTLALGDVELGTLCRRRYVARLWLWIWW